MKKIEGLFTSMESFYEKEEGAGGGGWGRGGEEEEEEEEVERWDSCPEMDKMTSFRSMVSSGPFKFMQT